MAEPYSTPGHQSPRPTLPETGLLWYFLWLVPISKKLEVGFVP